MGAHTHTHTHQRKSPEARSLIELSHRSTDCFFPSNTSLFSPFFLIQLRVGGGENKETEKLKRRLKKKSKVEKRGGKRQQEKKLR